jgi:hypothetical protein
MFFRISNLTVINLDHVVRVAHSPATGRLEATTTVLMAGESTEFAVHGERAVELWRLMRVLATGRRPVAGPRGGGVGARDRVGIPGMTLDSATLAG